MINKKKMKNIIASLIVWTIGMLLGAYLLGNHIVTGFFGALVMISIILFVDEITRKPQTPTAMQSKTNRD